MAVSPARECSEGRNRGEQPNTNRAIRAFKIEVSAITDDPLTAAGLPDEDDAHPEIAGLTCLSVEAHLIDNNDWRYYIAVAEYLTAEVVEVLREGGVNSAAARALSRSDPRDPATEPVTGGGGASVTTTRILYKDLDGKAVVNSAGQSFAETVTTPVTMARFTRKKVLITEPFDLITTYVNTVNSTAFVGLPADTVLCDSLTYTRMAKKRKGQPWLVRYPAEAHYLYNPAKFNPLEVLNAGFSEKLDDGTLRVIRDDEGHAYPNASMLAVGTGKKLAAGADPQFREFRVYKRNDLNEMGFS